MRSLSLFLILALSGCHQPGPVATDLKPEPAMIPEAPNTAVPESAPVSTITAEQELQQLQQAIRSMIGEAPASRVSQCKKVAFGYKACGGPSSWLVYSAEHSDEVLLLEKVARYNQLAEAESKRLGMMSDCAVVPEPAVMLVGGMCKAGAPGQASEL